jgi:hypothetical protein
MALDSKKGRIKYTFCTKVLLRAFTKNSAVVHQVAPVHILSWRVFKFLTKTYSVHELHLRWFSSHAVPYISVQLDTLVVLCFLMDPYLRAATVSSLIYLKAVLIIINGTFYSVWYVSIAGGSL